MNTGDKPNILLIMSDQHNPHVMGCAGNRVVRTPNLDGLAAEGVRFTDTSCSSPLCVPSRMGFMTGRLPTDIRVWSNGCRLDSGIKTFADCFNEAGYETILCGRMHFVGPDQFHGFQKRLFGEVRGSFLSAEDRKHRTNGQQASAVKNLVGPGDTGYMAYDREVVRVCRDWLKERVRSKDDRPFMLVAGLVSPHNPLRCPQDLFDEYLSQVTLPSLPEDYLETLHPARKFWREARQTDSITPDEATRALAAYYGLVTVTDGFVGRILDSLSKSGLLENTIVVYTTDHGDMAGEHGIWWKDNFHQGAVGVPLIFSWPGHFKEATSVDAITSLLDVGPTLLDIAGAPPIPHAWGRSLTRFLEGDKDISNWANEAISEYCGNRGDRPAVMLRQGRWKLIHYRGYDVPQLFNLAEDPDEFNDRASDPACAEIRKQLEDRVKREWDGDHIERTLAKPRDERRDSWTPPPAPPHEIPAWEPDPKANTLDGRVLPMQGDT